MYMEGSLSIQGNFGHLLSYRDVLKNSDTGPENDTESTGSTGDAHFDFEHLAQHVTNIFLGSYKSIYNDTVYLESMEYNVLHTLERNTTIGCIFIKCNGLSWSKLEHLMKYYPNTQHMLIVSNFLFGPDSDGLCFLNTHGKKLRNFLLFTQSRISKQIFDLWSKIVPKDGIHIYHCKNEDKDKD